MSHEKLPPHDTEFEGHVTIEAAIDSIIETLQDFKTRKDNIVKMNWTSSMFHLKIDMRLAEK